MPTGAAMAVSAGASVGKGILGIGAANDAKKAAEKAAADTNNYVRGVNSAATTNLSPYTTTGGEATGALAGLLGIGGNPAASANAFKNYLGSTNYQFLLNQGEQAVEYANAPAFKSSATAKALLNYGQGMAGNALQGYEGMLSGMSTQGIQAGSALGQIGMEGGNIINSANQGLAGTQGGAAMAGAGALGGMLTDFSKLAGQAATQSSFGGGGGGGSGGGGGYNYGLSMNALDGINMNFGN